MQEGLEQVIQEIDEYSSNHKDPFISIKTIAQKGWVGGLSYSSIKKLVESGELKSISLNLGGERGPIRKVHYADIKDYITRAYQREE